MNEGPGDPFGEATRESILRSIREDVETTVEQAIGVDKSRFDQADKAFNGDGATPLQAFEYFAYVGFSNLVYASLNNPTMALSRSDYLDVASRFLVAVIDPQNKPLYNVCLQNALTRAKDAEMPTQQDEVIVRRRLVAQGAISTLMSVCQGDIKKGLERHRANQM